MHVTEGTRQEMNTGYLFLVLMFIFPSFPSDPRGSRNKKRATVHLVCRLLPRATAQCHIGLSLRATQEDR